MPSAGTLQWSWLWIRKSSLWYHVFKFRVAPGSHHRPMKLNQVLQCAMSCRVTTLINLTNPSARYCACVRTHMLSLAWASRPWGAVQFLCDTAHNKVCGLSWVTGLWILVFFLGGCFKHHKPLTSILFERRQIYTAFLQNSATLTKTVQMET